MKQKENVWIEIESIKNNETELYSYLYDLAYNGQIKDMQFLENVFASFLSSKSDAIKRVSIYSLLFNLKIRKEYYKEAALAWAQDVNNEFNLRLMAMSGLGEAYFNTNDIQLLMFFLARYESEIEDEDVKAESFTDLLKVFGISALEIMRKNDSRLIISLGDIQENNFADELKKIRDLILNKGDKAGE